MSLYEDVLYLKTKKIGKVNTVAFRIMPATIKFPYSSIQLIISSQKTTTFLHVNPDDLQSISDKLLSWSMVIPLYADQLASQEQLIKEKFPTQGILEPIVKQAMSELTEEESNLLDSLLTKNTLTPGEKNANT